MNEIVQIGVYSFDKNLVIWTAFSLLIANVILGYFYLSVNQPELNLDHLHYKPVQPSQDLEQEVISPVKTESDLPILDSVGDDLSTLRFCNETCSVIDTNTDRVLCTFRKGSQNCRLMKCLFDNADTFLSEIELIEKISPANPESFYLKKLVCNLSIDKTLKERMFEWDANNLKLRLNSNIEIPAELLER